MEVSLNQLLARAVAIAAIAHHDQVDKAHAPYILHPIRLMMRGQTIEEQIVAVLHDVVEDSDWTLDQFAAEGFHPKLSPHWIASLVAPKKPITNFSIAS